MIKTVGGLIDLVILIVLLVWVWRSDRSGIAKVVWTIFGVLFSILTMIVWLIVNRGTGAKRSG
ncbi:hypothetical protein [Flexivirga caeni]|uniref:Cardiolipin synthase N-terminal domain-containing protein n=1 Tax=Flexivirga caeni TaxID=2294115 RepID=A0A3M9M709_9MICO|nr:hypothetical protein [Flexivirga caeni]RNI21312.1 hypothetical protein EFY87_11510 [Flexivirga caeni]